MYVVCTRYVSYVPYVRSPVRCSNLHFFFQVCYIPWYLIIHMYALMTKKANGVLDLALSAECRVSSVRVESVSSVEEYRA